MSKGAILTKSKDFAVRIIKLTRYLQDDKHEYVLSKQIMRSGTSIGANIREAFYAHGRADFISKLQIALKECYETEYWLELLKETNYINEQTFNDIYSLNLELLKLLTSIVKKSKENKLSKNFKRVH